MRTASIDIGTNTIRLLICEQSPEGDLQKLYIDRVITRLGEGFSKTKRLITTKAQERTVQALIKFSQIIEENNVQKIRAVATSVVRESENGLDFIKKAHNKTGIDIEVISGNEEAKLTVLGVINSISVKTDNCIIFDIGGGSTEYIYIHGGNIVYQTSIKLGVVHLTEEYLKSEIESPQELAQLSLIIGNIIKRELTDLKIHTNTKLSVIGTAGTPTTLAAMQLGLREYQPELVNGHVLNKTWISNIIESLTKTPMAKRSDIAGLEKGREDIIVTGSLILLKTLDMFSANELTVSDGGVLEGIAYSQLG